MTRRWTPGEDTAVRLADALDYEHGGRRLVELADRLGWTEAAVRQRASRLPHSSSSPTECSDLTSPGGNPAPRDQLPSALLTTHDQRRPDEGGAH